jgi:hypothetical protein
MSKEDTLREMDHAANEAHEELIEQFDRWTARDVARWWASWYLRAGHKRLGRLLVEMAERERGEN